MTETVGIIYTCSCQRRIFGGDYCLEISGKQEFLFLIFSYKQQMCVRPVSLIDATFVNQGVKFFYIIKILLIYLG